MTTTTFALALTMVVIISVAVPETSGSLIKRYPDPLSVGSRESGDRLLILRIVSSPSSFLSIVTQEFSFTTTNEETISHVYAFDLDNDGSGATASITNGGPGYNYVTVHFRSRLSSSINYSLQIYGIASSD